MQVKNVKIKTIEVEGNAKWKMSALFVVSVHALILMRENFHLMRLKIYWFYSEESLDHPWDFKEEIQIKFDTIENFL